MRGPHMGEYKITFNQVKGHMSKHRTGVPTRGISGTARSSEKAAYVSKKLPYGVSVWSSAQLVRQRAGRFLGF